jgi:hypothetical protein
LKVAAAATSEVWARRLYAYGRGREHLQDFGERDVAARLFEAHAQVVAGRCQSYQNRTPASMREARAARQNAFDVDL